MPVACWETGAGDETRRRARYRLDEYGPRVHGRRRRARDALGEQPTERKRQIGKLLRHTQLCVRTIVGSRKPVMACVNGVAAGFGFSFTAACDVVIAAEHATFASAYSRIGVSSDGGSTFTLPQALGRRRAAQWLYFAEQYSATEALRTFRAPPRTGLDLSHFCPKPERGRQRPRGSPGTAVMPSCSIA